MIKKIVEPILLPMLCPLYPNHIHGLILCIIAILNLVSTNDKMRGNYLR